MSDDGVRGPDGPRGPDGEVIGTDEEWDFWRSSVLDAAHEERPVVWLTVAIVVPLIAFWLWILWA